MHVYIANAIAMFRGLGISETPPEPLPITETLPESLPRNVFDVARNLIYDHRSPQVVDGHTVHLGDVQKERRRVFIVLPQDTGYHGSQGAKFYHAFLCDFTREATLAKIKEVVAICLDINPNNDRRVSIMQKLANKELFPKNYGFFRTNTHVIIQEKAKCDLFTLYDNNRGLHTLPFDEKKAIATSLLKAACKLKENKVIHRDIKLENILLCKGGIKLSDFGLAYAMGDDKAAAQSCGTLTDLAPEIIRWLYLILDSGSRDCVDLSSSTAESRLNEREPNVGFETDIWSLGLVLATLTNESMYDFEMSLYEFKKLLKERRNLQTAQELLDKPRVTREESDFINKCFTKYNIRLSSSAQKQIRQIKLQECMLTLDANIAGCKNRWSTQIKNLKKPPETITCLQDIVTCMLQEDPGERMTPEAALAALEKLKSPFA